MTTATAKLQLGTAALALAAAATLAPVVAQADTTAPLRPALTSFAQSLGGTAGQPVCAGTDTSNCVLVSAEQANALAAANATSSSNWFTPIFQNQLWWFGSPNPNPPTQNVIIDFHPIDLPIVGWFFNLFPGVNFEVCVAGLTTTIGPYLSTTISTSRGCA